MTTTSRKALWTAAAGVTTAAALALHRRRTTPPDAGNRWLSVTVNRGPGDIDPGKLPGPLGEPGQRIETRIRPAPGDRGTELAVRLVEPAPRAAHTLAARLTGQDPRQELRRALREAKALLETGEVMLPDAPPTVHDTPGGKLVGLLTRRAGGEGVL
jgi:hypothetical protein